MVRTLKVLEEYISECDYYYLEERTMLPLYRAARGKQILLTVRYNNPGRQLEDLELYLHDNETLASLRRHVFSKLKASPCSLRLELMVGSEPLDSADDRKTLVRIGIKDKTIINAKLSQVGSGAGASSPDSSSDSSSGSPQHNMYEGPNLEAEACLPGVILSYKGIHSSFFCNVSDLGSNLPDARLRDSAQDILKLLPPEAEVIRLIKQKCLEAQTNERSSLEEYFSSKSPSLTLYQLEVCHAMLLPAGGQQDVLGEAAYKIQSGIIQGGGVRTFLNMLVSNSLHSVDPVIRQQTYLVLLRLNKFLLLVVAHALLYMVVDAQSPESTFKVSTATHNHAVMLQQGLQAGFPCPGEIHVRQAAHRIGQALLQRGAGELPSMQHVRCIYRLAWAAAAGDLSLTAATSDQLRAATLATNNLPAELVSLAREAMETLTLAVALHPESMDALVKDKTWQSFVLDLVLLCKEQTIRIAAAEQFLMITTRATGETQYIKFMITLLFTVISNLVNQYPEQTSEYFLLMSRLLSYLASNRLSMTNINTLLGQEVDLLNKTRIKVGETGEPGISNTLMEGHLSVTRELVMFLPPDKKAEVGAGAKGAPGLVRELVEDWIFPASKLWVSYNQSGELPTHKTAVCQTPATTAAAFDLLVALCTGCQSNLCLLATMLDEMFYSEGEAVTEWDYLPPVGPRPAGGFVGLKNAGATCYMNSVLQQLFMIVGVQKGILLAEGACKDPTEDFSIDERNDDDTMEEEVDRNDYNVTILKQVQAIFGHLSETQLQYYIPKGLWKHFRMSGEPVNLREQQDAVEFFMTLIETLDEALKHLGHPQICSTVLGGVMADQKICKTCPHRYSRQEPCSVISVDVKNHSNLQDSLAEYTKGELLETENAYYCEQCDKKVDTVKRLAVKKLPPILVIQLKRFDYDFERETAVKFNDYFEFPRELDMEPYTVAGLARREKEAVDCGPEDLDPTVVRQYVLRGMVVHSGQASGGHYYSYIREGSKWYKFDDGDVTEVMMQDDEELKNQCWGGEYLSEVFDHVLKRMSVRRQKRWWNAYMLFYCRADLDDPVDAIAAGIQEMKLKRTKMPLPIETSIVKQNVKFLHNRNGFSAEYFNFIKKLISCNNGYVSVPPSGDREMTKDQEEIAMLTVKLASAFLFNVGFHTKKSVRGNAMDWYESLSIHLRCPPARAWFVNNVLFNHPPRFSEYLLECPGQEVRQAFSKLLVFCAHFTLNEPPSTTPACLQQNHIEVPPGANMSDHILLAALSLLWSEVADYGRQLNQYFNLFAMYCSLGLKEKAQLLKLNVPAIFIQVALDDGPGPPIKYQYAELSKLYQVVSNLIRCCDVSSVTAGSVEGTDPAPNPFIEPSLQGYILPIPNLVAEHLFQRSAYLKKLIEEANSTEETKKILQFCCWENPHFSHTVLYELLWQIAFAYTYELRPFLHLLLSMLMLEDSWQTHRILKALKGIPDDHSSRDGLFDTIQRSKNHYQKRAYQCIKMLVSLFSSCLAAKNILQANGDLKKKWTQSVEWLHDELDRGGAQRTPYNGAGAGTGYYSNWSPPAGSNETANGYFLERSHSARITLEKAFELLPEEEEDEGEEGAAAPGGARGDEDPTNQAKKTGGSGGQPTQRPADR